MLLPTVLAAILAVAVCDTAAPYGFSAVEALLKRADANQDGILSKAEVGQALSDDRNGDKKVSPEEFLLANPGPFGNRIFRLIDDDGNGFIELSDLDADYAVLDMDGNGQVSSKEFMTIMTGRLYALSILDPPTTTSAPRPDNSLQAAFNYVDLNNDGSLSVDEEWTGMLKLDTDGDSRVSRTEYLAQYANLSAEMQAAGPKFFVKFDVDNNGFFDRTDIVAAFPQADTNGDGSINFSEYSAFAIQLYASVGVHFGGSGQTSPSMTQTLTAIFRGLDANGDGKVSVPEKWADLLKTDKNHDYRISQDEYLTTFANMPPNIRPKGPSVFAKFDMDRSGFIDEGEVARLAAPADVDGDGMLSLTEYIGFVTKLLSVFPGSIDWVQNFKSVDTNGDGQWTVGEVWKDLLRVDTNGDYRISESEYLSNFSSQPPPLRETGPRLFAYLDTNRNGYLDEGEVAQSFNRVDRDGDSMVSLAEYQAFGAQLLAQITGGSSVINDFGFSQSDTNHDGKLSTQEAWAIFLQFDTNGNGVLEYPEYIANWQRSSPFMQNANMKFFGWLDADNSNTVDTAEFAPKFATLDLNGDGVTKDEFVLFILEHYDAFGVDITGQPDLGFDRIDSNRDGSITADEQWASLMLLDTNSDGKVSQAEFMAAYANQSQVFVDAGLGIFNMVDFDNNTFLERPEVTTGFKNLDSDGDGNVTRREYEGFVIQTYARFGINITQNPNPPSFAFPQIDSNSDGYLTGAEEWSAVLALDTNGDGKVSQAEYLASLAPAVRQAGPAIFSRIDANNTGYIEMSDVQRFFGVVDKDGDGRLSLPEYAGFLATLLSSLGVDLSAIYNGTRVNDLGFSTIDTNRDGFVTVDEEWNVTLSFDTDGDGKVSQQEYIRTLPPDVAPVGSTIFSRFDFDGSGFFEQNDIRKFVTMVDTNSDGKMSIAEYMTFVGSLLTGLGVDIS